MNNNSDPEKHLPEPVKDPGNYIPFNPERDKGVKRLFEIQSRRHKSKDGGEIIASVIVPSEDTYDVAKEIPWYYFVHIDDVQGISRSAPDEEGAD